MSRRLAPVTRTYLVKRFRQLGWEGPKSGKKHELMVKGKQKVWIPNPHKHKDIGIDLLSEILKEAGIPRNEWLEH